MTAIVANLDWRFSLRETRLVLSSQHSDENDKNTPSRAKVRLA